MFRESVIGQLAQAAMESLDQQELERQAIGSCLAKLPDDQRSFVLSVHSPGESIARIAAETGEKARRLYSKVNALRKILLECVHGEIGGEVQRG